MLHDSESDRDTSNERLRIAPVAPLYESVPPQLYGGTERVVSWLTEKLVALGHDVTLFASGDSRTRGHLVPVRPMALWRDPNARETLPQHVRMLELVFRDLSRFDVVHFHCDYIHFPLVRRLACANVSTLHGQIHLHDGNFRNTTNCRLSRFRMRNSALCRALTGRRPNITVCHVC